MVKRFIFPVAVVVGLLQSGLYFDEKQVSHKVMYAIHDVDTMNITEIEKAFYEDLGGEQDDDEEESSEEETHDFLFVEPKTRAATTAPATTRTESDESEIVSSNDADTVTAPSKAAAARKESQIKTGRESLSTTTTTTTTEANLERERLYYDHHYQEIVKLVNESSIMDWNRNRRKRGKYRQWLDHFDYHELTNFSAEAIANVDKMFFRWDGQLCNVAKAFDRYHKQYPNTPKPHILLGRLNQDFGVLSSTIKGKTGRFKKLPQEWISAGCSEQFVMDYINHPDTLAIFTTQFQRWSIPKVISIPLGLQAAGSALPTHLLNQVKMYTPAKNRTQLLMLNSKEWAGRKDSFAKIIENFKDYGDEALQNTYNNYNHTACPYHPRNLNAKLCYYWEMSQSKFIVSPSGLGVDCYRTWEAIYVGVIPVVERLSKTDGWFENTLADLPIAWIDDFKDLTPEYLEEQYDRLVHRTPPTDYKFEKLTRQYWINMAHSIVAEHQKKLAAESGDNNFEPEEGDEEVPQPPEGSTPQEDDGLDEANTSPTTQSSATLESNADAGGSQDEDDEEEAEEKERDLTQRSVTETLTGVSRWDESLGDKEKEQLYYDHHHQEIVKLVNDSTLMDWNRDRRRKGKYRQWLDHFDYHELTNMSAEAIANVEKMFFRSDGQLCDIAKAFDRYHKQYPNTPKPHILLGRLNQDFGVLSSTIKGKTGRFKKLPGAWISAGCSEQFVMDYINHPDTLAIFTTQFQRWSIPKVISIPLGLSAGTHDSLLNQMQFYTPAKNRTQLLMLNSKEWAGRKDSFAKIIENFKDYGDEALQNTYNNYDHTACPYHPRNLNAKLCYYWEMSQSKFIVSPSGLGVDCYRTWEAIYVGVIPVVERLSKTDGWFENTLADLPIAWIDDFKDLTPEYLEEQYDRLVHRTPPSEYKFEKMTRQYWINMAYSILEKHKQKVAGGRVKRAQKRLR